jgi:hypothetical protein
MAKYEVEIEVEKKTVEKRNDLVAQFSTALYLAGVRVTAGTYKVTIERLPAPSKKEEESTNES